MNSWTSTKTVAESDPIVGSQQMEEDPERCILLPRNWFLVVVVVVVFHNLAVALPSLFINCHLRSLQDKARLLHTK